MATITFTATLPSGETVTRTSGTMPYVATVNGVTWHKTFASAQKAATGRQHGPGAQVIPVVPTAINGKITAEDWADGWGEIDREVLATLVAAKLADQAPKAKAPRKAKAKVVTGQEILDLASADDVVAQLDAMEAEAPAELPTEDAPAADPVEETVTEAIAAIEAQVDAPVVKRVSRKQALGDQIIALVHAALADDTIVMPEGMDHTEARESIAKWLQHVPSSTNPGGRRARPGDAARKAAKAK